MATFRMTRQANSKGKVVKAPLVVHKYNQTMGGVDLGDQLISQYDHITKCFTTIVAMATYILSFYFHCRGMV
jgi:hypothetical protein